MRLGYTLRTIYHRRPFHFRTCHFASKRGILPQLAKIHIIHHNLTASSYSTTASLPGAYTRIIADKLQAVMVTLNLSSPKYYIGAIDQGTSSTRFLLFDDSSKVVLSTAVPVFTDSPKPG
jgi:hypothetical protein